MNAPPDAPAALLHRLARGDERELRAVLAPAAGRAAGLDASGLTPRMSSLVSVAALLALGASTTTLRWAVERSWCLGADDEEIAEVLAAVGAVAGCSCVAASAPRLALAIGYDLDAGPTSS